MAWYSEGPLSRITGVVGGAIDDVLRVRRAWHWDTPRPHGGGRRRRLLVQAADPRQHRQPVPEHVPVLPHRRRAGAAAQLEPAPEIRLEPGSLSGGESFF